MKKQALRYGALALAFVGAGALLVLLSVVVLAAAVLVDGSFQAIPMEQAMRVVWETASETDMLGFYVHRAPYQALPEGAECSAVSALDPLPGFVWAQGDVGGASYAYTDTQNLVVGQVYYYCLEAVDQNGSEFHGPITGTIPLPSPSWRVGVTADGLYRLTYETLIAAGVPIAGAVPSDFQLLWRGQEVALQEVGTGDDTFDPGDALLFYGKKFHGSVQDEKYTDENVYWLTVDDTTPGLRMGSRSVAPDGTGQPLAWYTSTVRTEENTVYMPRYSSVPETDATWFWDKLQGQTYPVTRTYPITLPSPADGVYTASLTVEMARRSGSTHVIRFAFNGVSLGSRTWTGVKGWATTLSLPSSSIQSGVNTLAVTVENGPEVYLNWFEIAYRRWPAADGDALLWSPPLAGPTAMTLTGFTTHTVGLYDVTHPLAPTRLVSTTAHLSGTTYTLALQDVTALENAYLAVADSAVADVPSLMAYHPPIDLLNSTVGADEIVIAPAGFFTAVQPLVDLRRSQGLRVQVVDVADIYPLFNGGVFHPEAIRAFVAYAHANWPAPSPAYLLLVGDGNFNFKGYNPADYGTFTPSLIPPYLAFADSVQGEVAVDSRYGDVDGDGMPEVAVGRIPAGSVEELEAVVDKIIAYETQPVGVGAGRVLFAADDYDANVGDFKDVLEGLARDFLPTGVETRTVYLDDYTSTDVISARLALTQTWSEGAALVTYAGHGFINFWAGEGLLVPGDVPGFQPGHRMPFVLSLDCLDGYWMSTPKYPSSRMKETRSVAEALLVTPERGAVAVFAPAGMGYLAPERTMARAMYQAMFEEGAFQLGPLTQKGREAVAGAEMARTYTLFGDPAMQLVILTNRVYLPLALRNF